MTQVAVLSDRPAEEDLLNFHRYVDPLASILTNPKTETPFTIGIFGTWGSGKSTLLHLLDEKLEASHRNAFVRVHFNPWIHRGEENMLIPLLHTLQDTLQEEADKKKRFTEAAKKVGSILLWLGADALLKALTAPAPWAQGVSVDRIDELEQRYHEKRGEVESEIRKIRKNLKAAIESIKKEGAQLVLFIDDLDRSEPDEIIDLLEAVKLFLDLRHVFVILAVDKEVIDRGVTVKYSKFDFGKRAAVVGAEYLEKMVQLPLRLYPLDKDQVQGFMERLVPPDSVKQQLALLAGMVMPNPRKIKRILNILAVTLAIKERTPGLDGLRDDLIARLVVLQVQSSQLYAEVIKDSDVLLALEKVYQKKITLGDIKDFADYKNRAKNIQTISKDNYEPGSFLKDLFAESDFNQVKNEISQYLTMLGG